MLEREPAAPRIDAPLAAWRFGSILLVAIVWLALILAHHRGANGPWYWTWTWQRLPVWPIVPAMLAAAVPVSIAQWLGPMRRRFRSAVVLLVVGNVALQWASVSCQPHSAGRLPVDEIVDSAAITSYYTAAEILFREQQAGHMQFSDWLSGFSSLQEDGLMGHARYKPPGLILYYMLWLNCFGPGAAARVVGGAVIGLLGALGIATTYALMREFGFSRESSFASATCVALTPSLIAFFPQFDQAYLPVAALLIIGWRRSLTKGHATTAVLFGLSLGMASFFTYSFLMLGVFFLTYAILFIGDRLLPGVKIVLQQGVLAGATFAAFYLAVWLITGFDAIAVYRTTFRLNLGLTVNLGRPFPIHIPMDFLDLALGIGWITVPLLLMGLWRLASATRRADSRTRLAVVGLLQVGTATGAALFPAEEARIFLMLMPLLIVGAGFELSHWPTWSRLTAYALLLAITIATVQNMVFMRLPI